MLANAYVFTGNSFLVRQLRLEWTRRFADKHGAEGLSSFNVRDPQGVDELISALRSRPFFTSKRLLVAHGNPFAAKPEGAGRRRKADQDKPERLLAALSDADEDCIIVFADEDNGEWPDSFAETNMRRLHAMDGRVYGFDPKGPVPLVSFLQRILGTTVPEAAVQQAVSMAVKAAGRGGETELFGPFHVLQQVACLPPERQGADAVALLLQVEAEDRGYDLAALLCQNRARDALLRITTLLRQGDVPRQVFRLLCTQATELLKVRLLLNDRSGLSAAAIAKELGRKPTYGIQRLLESATQLRTEDLQRLCDRLAALNVAMHTGQVDGDREDTFLSALIAFTLRSDAGTSSVKSSNTRPGASRRRPDLYGARPA